MSQGRSPSSPEERPVPSEDVSVTETEEDMLVREAKTNGNSQRPNHVSTVVLADVPIVALLIDGKERLCLAQISNTLLKGYSYNEIHNRRVALGITCVQCTPVQLEILRRAGAMPVSSRRCGMITKREAERLVKSFLEDTTPPKLPEDFAFDVQHDCGWGCRGNFIPSRYNSSRAKCIKCAYCNMYFSPNKFIFHYHRTPDAKYNHPDAANFNSWRRHLRLTSGLENTDLVYAWEDVKAMFNGGSRKRMSSCSSRLESQSQKSSYEESKKPRFHDTSLEVKSHRTPPLDYNPYPIFPTPTSSSTYPILPATFPPVPLSLSVPSPHSDRSPFGTPNRGTLATNQITPDFSGTSRARQVSGMFCSPFDKIWPKYPSLFFSGGHNMNFSRCDRLMASDQSALKILGFKSPKLSPPGKRDATPTPPNHVGTLPRDPVSSFGVRNEDKEWCSAFRLVGTSGKHSSLNNGRAESVKCKEPMECGPLMKGDGESINTESRTEGKISYHAEEAIGADEDSDEELSVKDQDVDIEDDDEDTECRDKESLPDASTENDVLRAEPPPNEKNDLEKCHEILSEEEQEKMSHRKETADSTSGSTDFSSLSREQLQTELQQEMEARKKIEKECTTIKETFEEQMKREMQYKDDISKQLQVVRETLCTKLDQERKVRMSLQDKLKEAQYALHSFTCNMLASRHCTECSVKEILPR